ncbi:MAG TPA: hypothetical protein VK145_03160 [Candidatus Nanoarchaeia archaeon]|nr:hypothetical protein [Candidatus Nanoarchaeia archaeon]
MEHQPRRAMDRKRMIGTFVTVGIISRISNAVEHESGLGNEASFVILGSLFVLVVVISLLSLAKLFTQQKPRHDAGFVF